MTNTIKPISPINNYMQRPQNEPQFINITDCADNRTSLEILMARCLQDMAKEMHELYREIDPSYDIINATPLIVRARVLMSEVFPI